MKKKNDKNQSFTFSSPIPHAPPRSQKQQATTTVFMIKIPQFLASPQRQQQHSLANHNNNKNSTTRSCVSFHFTTKNIYNTTPEEKQRSRSVCTRTHSENNKATGSGGDRSRGSAHPRRHGDVFVCANFHASDELQHPLFLLPPHT